MKTTPILQALFGFILALPAMAGQSGTATSPEQVPEGLEKSDWQSIRAAHEGWKHRFHAVEGGWQANNPGQQWTTRFDGREFLATPKDANWTWGLQFQSYGFGDNLIEVSGTPEVRVREQRLTYQWDDNVEEWYVNDQRGLEHGFIIKERPAGGKDGEPLVFTMGTVGSLKPTVSSDAQTVHFRDAVNAPVLNYSGLKVWDAQGTVLASRFMRDSNGLFRIAVEEKDATYPLTIDPIAQQAYLKSDNNGGQSADNFGYSVAISGDTVVIGAPYEDSSSTGVNSTPIESVSHALSGAAYIFVRDGVTWSQQAYLKASNTGANDSFGHSVAISGDTVVVGARHEDSGTIGVNSTSDEATPNSGAAYVFVRSGTTWSQQAYLKASNPGGGASPLLPGDSFGASVAVSGDTVVVGACWEDSGTTGVNSVPDENQIDSGAAYVFVRSGTDWSQQAYLKASNTGADDWFGYTVGVSGDTVIVGAYREDSNTTGINSTPNENAGNAGAAYVFVRSGTNWSQQAYLKASNTGANDQFGVSVAVSGNTAIVGANFEDSTSGGVNGTPDEGALDSGAAYVFFRSGTNWIQQAYLKAASPLFNDRFGVAVAVDGDTAVIGAHLEDTGSPQSGAAYVFLRSSGLWTQQGFMKASNIGGSDEFGFSVAVSSDTVIIGAPFEDSNTTGVNSTPNERAPNAGAAYLFLRSAGSWSPQAFVKASNTSFGPGVGDNFGRSVAISGNTVVVGAPEEDSFSTGVNSIPTEGSTSTGAAYVFVRSGSAWTQQAYLKASNSGFGDRFGWSVAVSGDTIVVGAIEEDSVTTGVNSVPVYTGDISQNSGAAYVFVRSGTIWSQQAYLKSSNNSSDDQFGEAVAIDGDTVMVGVRREDGSSTGVNSAPNDGAADAGAVYIFHRTGETWVQQAYVKASNTGAGDAFGSSVSISGDTAVVGAHLEDSNATGVNGSGANNSSSSSGAVYVFSRSGGSWSQDAYIKASNTGNGDNFGISVSVSGDRMVIGAQQEDGGSSGVNGDQSSNSSSNSGAAYIFGRSGGAWSQEAYLKSSNNGAGDNFGGSVAISGDIVVVGARSEDSGTTGINGIPDEGASEAGAAYVFVSNGGVWSQQAYVKASNTGPGDWFGHSVAASGDTVVVGAYLEDSSTAGVNTTPDDGATDSGAAYIFSGFGAVNSPEIGIEQAGSDVPTGSTHPFGSVANGSSLNRVFSILNTGTANLTLSGSPQQVSVSGSGDFTITSQPASGDIAPGGSASFTVRFTPTGSGPKSATLSIANNDGDEDPFVIQLTGTATTASSLFANTITSGTSLTGDDALPTATPFGDGVANLLKYAFNMNLAGPDVSKLSPVTGTSGLPAITTPDDAPPGTLRFEFLRRKGSGLAYTPQKSTTLDGSNWSSLTASPVVTSIDDQWERVVYTEAPDPIPAPACFGRVEVVIP